MSGQTAHSRSDRDDDEDDTGDALEGTSSEDIESGDEDVPQPPDEGLPS